MSDDPIFSMAVRTGNWGPMVMLPFHKPVTIILAPKDAVEVVLRFKRGLTALPAELGAADLDRVTVADPGGRPVLLVDRDAGTVERRAAHPQPPVRAWELRLEGPRGVLVLYSLGDDFPSAELLERLAERLPVSASA